MGVIKMVYIAPRYRQGRGHVDGREWLHLHVTVQTRPQTYRGGVGGVIVVGRCGVDNTGSLFNVSQDHSWTSVKTSHVIVSYE